MAIAALLRAALNPFIDFIYPPVCLTCKHILAEREERICSRCWDSFTTLDPSGGRISDIRMRFLMDGFVSDCLSCYSFEKEGRFQEVIHLLKYGGMSSLGVQLGREIGRTIRSDQRFAAADLVVPVPLHSLKKRERGYNQCDYLCHGISEVVHIPVERSLLVRTRYTESQTQLSVGKRKENVEGAFSIKPRCAAMLKGKVIMVVDDVITTGATIAACARVIFEHGASSVLAASAGLAS